MSTADRPSRDEVERAITTLRRFIKHAQKNVLRYGTGFNGFTFAEIVIASEDFSLAVDVIEPLNDALPSEVNG